MERNEITAKLIEIMHEVTPDTKNISNINESMSLTNDLGFDSVSLLMMAVNIEDAFGISCENIESSNLETLGSIIDFIDKNLK